MRQDVKADFAALDTFASSLEGALGTLDVAAYDRAISAYLNSGANDFGAGGVWNRTGLAELVMSEIGAQGRAAVEFAEWLRQWDANGDGIFDGWIDEHDMDVINAMIRDWESGFEFGALRDRASAQVDELQEAIDSGDQATIEAALAAFEGWADNPELAKELVRVLGPEGLADLYDRLDRVVDDRYLDVESLWEHGLRHLNDAVASGMSALGDEEFGGFVVEFIDQDGARAAHLALITASDHADAQVAAAAALVAGEIYLPSGSGGSLYPQVFHYAYDLDVTTPTEAILARASGEAMADLLQAIHPDERDDLVWRWMLRSDRGEDDWADNVGLFASTFAALAEQAVDGHAAVDADQANRQSVIALLMQHAASGPDSYDPRSLARAIAPTTTDPAFLSWLLRRGSDRQNEGLADLNRVLDLADVDGDRLVGELLHQMAVVEGLPQARVAETLGYLLAHDDVLGSKINLDGVVKSLVNSAISLGVKTPLTGPVLGVFNALAAEMERIEASRESIQDAMGNEAEQNLIGITLYTALHGEPAGMGQWIVDNGFEDDPYGPLEWYLHQADQETTVYGEIEDLVRLIDEARDEV